MNECEQCKQKFYLVNMFKNDYGVTNICKQCNRLNYLENKVKKRRIKVLEQRLRFSSKRKKESVAEETNE